MYILGLNAYHADSAACLMRDGALIAAAEEERFRRIKHWAGFPSEAIRYCLEEAGIGLGDIAHVALNRDPKANYWKKVAYTLTRRPSPALVLARMKNARKWSGVGEELARSFPDQRFGGAVHHIEHHLAHLASAFLVSPFEDAAVVSLDGFGDFSSAAWGRGQGADIAIDGRVGFPHSLGIFYQALTQHLGFPRYGDEYKVMGLAPYGAPGFMAEMRQIVGLEPDGGFTLDLRYFRHHKENVAYEWLDSEPTVGLLYTPALTALMGPPRAPDEKIGQRHMDIARSIQAMYEEAVFHMYNTLHRRHGCDALVIAGGCGFNSVANGRVYGATPFRRTYVQAAAGDAGGAIGAAAIVWRRLKGGRPASVMNHAFWGPGFDNEEIAAALAARADTLDGDGFTTERIGDERTLSQRTAEAIAQGKVIGWFQGRMEWGPRALGNRSILADPRRADMKDILNIKIKRRESFRPFAPSILREAAGAWFETDDDVPFMMKVFQIRPEKRDLIPAITHVDGSGRLQTVRREANPRYYRLIEDFNALTCVPMVLNTSFNENEPVVCRPEEALDCFLRTHMDVLVMGDYFVGRRAPAASSA
jgi:carbamoyltransferase